MDVNVGDYVGAIDATTSLNEPFRQAMRVVATDKCVVLMHPDVYTTRGVSHEQYAVPHEDIFRVFDSVDVGNQVMSLAYQAWFAGQRRVDIAASARDETTIMVVETGLYAKRS